MPGAPPSFAHVSLYAGFRHDAAALGLERSNLWVYPDDDHDRSVARFLADPEAPLPVAYLSFPSAKDPDFANRFPGRATVEVIGVAPYAAFAPWAGGHAEGLLLGGFANAAWRFGGCWQVVPELSLHVTAAGEVPVRGTVAQLGVAIGRGW